MTNGSAAFRLLAPLLALLLLPLLTACGSQSDLSSELQTLSSWAATVQMAGGAWEEGNVPDAYTRDTLDEAQDEINSAAGSIASSGGAQTPVPGGGTLAQHVQNLQNAVKGVAGSVDKGDRAAVATPLAQLSAEQQALDKLSQATGGGQ